MGSETDRLSAVLRFSGESDPVATGRVWRVDVQDVWTSVRTKWPA